MGWGTGGPGGGWGCSAAQPLPGVGAHPVPHPGPLPPFTERWSWALGPGLSTPTSPTGLSDLFLRNFQPPWNCRSHFRACWMVVPPLLPPPLPPAPPGRGDRPEERPPRSSLEMKRAFLLQSIGSGRTSVDSTEILPPPHTLFSLSRLRGPTQAPMAARPSTPALPGPAAQAGRARHG